MNTHLRPTHHGLAAWHPQSLTEADVQRGDSGRSAATIGDGALAPNAVT